MSPPCLYIDSVFDVIILICSGYQESELRYLTFLYTCPLTVLYAAEQSGLADGKSVDTVTSLTIHLVGARIAEVFSFL